MALLNSSAVKEKCPYGKHQPDWWSSRGPPSVSLCWACGEYTVLRVSNQGRPWLPPCPFLVLIRARSLLHGSRPRRKERETLVAHKSLGSRALIAPYLGIATSHTGPPHPSLSTEAGRREREPLVTRFVRQAYSSSKYLLDGRTREGLRRERFSWGVSFTSTPWTSPHLQQQVSEEPQEQSRWADIECSLQDALVIVRVCRGRALSVSLSLSVVRQKPGSLPLRRYVS